MADPGHDQQEGQHAQRQPRDVERREGPAAAEGPDRGPEIVPGQGRDEARGLPRGASAPSRGGGLEELPSNDSRLAERQGRFPKSFFRGPAARRQVVDLVAQVRLDLGDLTRLERRVRLHAFAPFPDGVF